MMKYKLIKEYPGSPKLGHVICCNDFTHNGVDRHSCSDYPEFWEQVAEKDYEIITLKNYNNINVVNHFTNDILIKLLANENTSIHSVKRLSDGEVFTVGDIVDGIGIYDKNIKIEAMKIKEDNSDIMIFNSGVYFQNLSTTIKSRQPLFTTEDGVDIYDPRQKVFSVSECDFKLQDHQDYGWIMTRIIERKYHHFSTKEKAEKYIINNKPCLSIQDILNVYTWDKHSFRNSVQLTEKELKELVKQKLNK